MRLCVSDEHLSRAQSVLMSCGWFSYRRRGGTGAARDALSERVRNSHDVRAGGGGGARLREISDRWTKVVKYLNSS